MALKDTDEMPFGKYKGTRMIDVPASYLLFLWEQNKFSYQSGREVKTYIQDKLEALKMEQNKNINNGKDRIK